MKTPPFLLHVCCAPCLITALTTLRQPENGIPPPAGIFFYNPNIHPLLEFRRREKALRVYLERDSLSAEIDSTYGLGLFLATVLENGRLPADRRERCRRCYRLRLEQTARQAAHAGFSAFSSTLLASREQDRGLVAEEGRQAAEKNGIAFIETDLRRFLPEEKMFRGIYRQQYCGCVFSEEERYRNSNKHVYGAVEATRSAGQDASDGNAAEA